MKITVITCPFLELPPIAIGAVEKLFYLLAGEWVRLGHRVCFVCAGGGDDTNMRFIRLKKYARTGSTKKDLIWDFIYSMKAIWRCPKTDVLVCNTFWSPFLAPLMWWKYKKLIYGVHRFPKKQFFLYPFVKKFICVSTVVADELKKQIDPRRIAVIVNPIDMSVFSLRSRKPVKGRVVYAGRVHPLKGLLCLARACARLCEEGLVGELMVAGTWDLGKGGGGAEFVEELKNQSGACKVMFRGMVSDPEELAEIERSAEVFVYPSVDEKGEACPVAPMEAMALGVPTIVSDMKCFRDYLENGKNGMAFVRENVESLVSCIKMGILEKERMKMLTAKAVRIGETFSASRVAGRYIDVFSE